MDTTYWILYCLVVLSTLAIHESGHALRMAALGVKIERVTLGVGPALRMWGNFYLGLFPLGASVSPNPEQWEALSAYDKFMIAVAGPVASFCGGAVMLGVAMLDPKHAGALAVFAGMHFILGMINLIPIPPLDGWVALTSLLQLKKLPLPDKALAFAQRAGNGLIYGFGFWFVGKIVSGDF